MVDSVIRMEDHTRARDGTSRTFNILLFFPIICDNICEIGSIQHMQWPKCAYCIINMHKSGVLIYPTLMFNRWISSNAFFSVWKYRCRKIGSLLFFLRLQRNFFPLSFDFDRLFWAVWCLCDTGNAIGYILRLITRSFYPSNGPTTTKTQTHAHMHRSIDCDSLGPLANWPSSSYANKFRYADFAASTF